MIELPIFGEKCCNLVRPRYLSLSAAADAGPDRDFSALPDSGRSK
jgi:hypothetical protein